MMDECTGCEKLRKRIRDLESHVFRLEAQHSAAVTFARMLWDKDGTKGLTVAVAKDKIDGINTGLGEPQGGAS